MSDLYDEFKPLTDSLESISRALVGRIKYLVDLGQEKITYEQRDELRFMSKTMMPATDRMIEKYNAMVARLLQ